MNSAFNLYLPQTLKTLLELKHELSSVSWASFDLRPFLKERKKGSDHSNPIGNQFLAVTTKTIGKMNDFFIFALDSTSTSASSSSSSSASRLSLKIVKKRRKKCFAISENEEAVEEVSAFLQFLSRLNFLKEVSLAERRWRRFKTEQFVTRGSRLGPVKKNDHW